MSSLIAEVTSPIWWAISISLYILVLFTWNKMHQLQVRRNLRRGH